MQTDHLIALLSDAITRYLAQSFDHFSSLGDEHLFEEIGTPGGGPDGDYCQIEVEILDRFEENGIKVIHVPVTVQDGYKQFGATLFFYGDGRTCWDNTIYEFQEGVPYPIKPGWAERSL